MQFDPSEIDIPFIPIEKIWEIAEHFRSEHWPSGKLPIDIMDIAEIGLNLYIVPKSRLKDKFDIDAYLTMDCSSIYVDLQDFENDKMQNRLRFSIAHEIGHYILHRNIYKDIFDKLPDSIDEWIDFQDLIPKYQYERIEWQAFEFAGHLLVPRESLEKDLKRELRKLKGIEIPEFEIMGKNYISSNICRKYGVSYQVINVRLEREKFWPPKDIFIP